jgi:uncharacterized membrane protein
MHAAGAGLAIVVLMVGITAGWYANRAHAAHGDVKSTRGRIPGYRRTRARSGLIAVALLAIALFALKDLAQH